MHDSDGGAGGDGVDAAASAVGPGRGAARFLVVFAVVDGRPRSDTVKASRKSFESAGSLLPPAVLLALSLWLGLFTPAVLRESWAAAVSQLFPTP